MESSKDKFLTLLDKELLKVDLADLDFGFYRILKYRREEVKAFFGQRLPEILAEAMQGQAADRATQVRNRLKSLTDSLETAAPTLGLAGAFTDGRLDEHLAALPAGRDYLALIAEQELLGAAAGFSQSEEERLYNHLYLFFSRYYADGDFIGQPRRGRDGRYSVAYNGEDVHYARKHRIDYFVHPALGAFLKAELDWYLKSEFLDVEAFTDPEGMTNKFIKFHALRKIGGLIIDFLDQVETFQAALFEKRKFVLRTDWLAPVRMLDPALWPEIVKSPAQLAAWRDLFGLKGRITVETLKAQPTLVVDTRHFDEGFKLRLLACYPNIDEALDGVLVHAENYAAVRTLEYRYRGRVKSIYIDPPYNTGKDDFLYKDEFSRHSTWLTMADERLRLFAAMLDPAGTLFCSIDGNEYIYIHELLNQVFGRANCVGTIVWKGATDNNPTRIQLEHEYIECFIKDTEMNEKIGKSPNIEAKELMIDEYQRLKDKYTEISEIQKEFWKFVKNNQEALQPLTHYDRVDEDGPYTGSRKVHNPGKEGYRYDVRHPNGRTCVEPARSRSVPMMVAHIPISPPTRGV